jgi:hypothetical protein
LLGPLRLLGEHSDRFNKVLVGVSIIGNVVTKLRNHIKRISIVELLEARNDDLRKFKTHESATWSQNSVGLFERFASVCNVADTKGNRVQIHGVVLKTLQFLSIENLELQIVIDSLLNGTLLADFEHVRVDIAHSNVHSEALGVVWVVTFALLKDLKRDVTSATSYIQASHWHKLVG